MFCEWLSETSVLSSRASEAGFHQSPSLPDGAATAACPAPTVRAPIGTSRKSAPSLDSVPWPIAGLGEPRARTRAATRGTAA